MTRRPAFWQAEKARTAKALRALPLCDTADCKRRGMGMVVIDGDAAWLCPYHAQQARADAPRGT